MKTFDLIWLCFEKKLRAARIWTYLFFTAVNIFHLVHLNAKFVKSNERNEVYLEVKLTEEWKTGKLFS